MRVRFVFFVVFSVISSVYFLSHLVAFIQIFFKHSGIAITQDDVLAAHFASSQENKTQLIPKIIHQVYHDWRSVDGGNSSMPADWDELRQTCIDLNEGWEYILWTKETSRAFIEKQYPWFLSTYDGYKFPVQRVDSLRYFLLRYHGGIYLDLDNGCASNLTPLLDLPAFTTDGGRGALSNNILGSLPSHPFYILLTDSLIPYNYNYLFPYITISYASGQWFETAIWETYHSSLFRWSLRENEVAKSTSNGSKVKGHSHREEDKIYRIMMDDRPGADKWAFFTQERGGTWVNWDNRLFLWIGDHLLLLGVFIAGVTATTSCIFVRLARGRRRLKRRVGREDGSVKEKIEAGRGKMKELEMMEFLLESR